MDRVVENFVLAIHHCQMLHHTEPNTTDYQCRALAIHYMVPGTRSLRTGEYLGVSLPTVCTNSEWRWMMRSPAVIEQHGTAPEPYP